MKVPLLSLALIALAGGASAQGSPHITAVSECFVSLPENMAEHSGVDCGYVVVPQSRSGGPAGEISLAFMRLRAAADTGAPPLFMLAGGPGQTIITDGQMALFQPEFLGPVLSKRDVVLLEQRGTFRAKPSLTCPEARPAAYEALVGRLDPQAAEAQGREILQRCIDRHRADGVDFASYNSVESAADIDDARAALGYDRIIFYGASYGTLLGQFVMREFPGSLAAVILDGAETPSTRSWVENRAERAQWGLDRMSELCAGQPDCAATFDIPALVEAVFDVFGEDPITVSVSLPEGAPSKGDVEATVAPEGLAAVIYGLQTSKYGVGALPSFLAQYEAAGREALAQMLATQTVNAAIAAISDDESESVNLMHMAMVCSDDPPRSTDEAKMAGAGRYARTFGGAEAGNYRELCDLMAVPELPESSDALVRTDVPVLVLSGGLDVQTPYFLADEVVANLPNAAHVVFPSGFHVQIANLNRCAIAVALSFIDDPHAKLDLGCSSSVADVAFAIPEPAAPGAEK